MSKDDTRIVSLLLGYRSQRIAEMEQEGIVPPFLAGKYARESAAREAAAMGELPPVLIAALLRAAFLDEEEDVRAAARHALILRDEHIGDAIHLALSMEDDPSVRESAFDEANEVPEGPRRIRLIRQAVEALEYDECEHIRARARKFAQTLPVRE